MSWFSDLKKELRGERLPGTHGGPPYLGRWYEIPNPPKSLGDIDPSGQWGYNPVDGYAVEPDGEVVKSVGLIRGLFGG